MITNIFVCILKAISRKFAKKLDKDFAEKSRDVQQSCDTFESIIAVFQNAEVLTERERGKFVPFFLKHNSMCHEILLIYCISSHQCNTVFIMIQICISEPGAGSYTNPDRNCLANNKNLMTLDNVPDYTGYCKELKMLQYNKMRS